MCPNAVFQILLDLENLEQFILACSLMVLLHDPVQVAVKTLNSQCSESDRVKFLKEAAIMGQFVHNNVVQLHGVVTEEENMMIVLEYMPKGDLHNYLLKTRTL